MPQMIVFQAGNMHFVIDQHRMDVIEPWTPGSEADQRRNQRQTIEYKGRSCRLVDLSTALGPEVAHPHTADAKVIVTKGAPALALWADRIKDQITVETTALKLLPSVFTRSAGICFSKVLRLEDQLALVIDTAALEKLAKKVAPPVMANRLQSESAGAVSLPGKTGSESRTFDNMGGHALESIVAQKLQLIIERRVNQAVARTMAETFG